MIKQIKFNNNIYSLGVNADSITGLPNYVISNEYNSLVAGSNVIASQKALYDLANDIKTNINSSDDKAVNWTEDVLSYYDYTNDIYNFSDACFRLGTKAFDKNIVIKSLYNNKHIEVPTKITFGTDSKYIKTLKFDDTEELFYNNIYNNFNIVINGYIENNFDFRIQGFFNGNLILPINSYRNLALNFQLINLYSFNKDLILPSSIKNLTITSCPNFNANLIGLKDLNSIAMAGCTNFSKGFINNQIKANYLNLSYLSNYYGTICFDQMNPSDGKSKIIGIEYCHFNTIVFNWVDNLQSASYIWNDVFYNIKNNTASNNSRWSQFKNNFNSKIIFTGNIPKYWDNFYYLMNVPNEPYIIPKEAESINGFFIGSNFNNFLDLSNCNNLKSVVNLFRSSNYRYPETIFPVSVNNFFCCFYYANINDVNMNIYVYGGENLNLKNFFDIYNCSNSSVNFYFYNNLLKLSDFNYAFNSGFYKLNNATRTTRFNIYLNKEIQLAPFYLNIGGENTVYIKNSYNEYFYINTAHYHFRIQFWNNL